MNKLYSEDTIKSITPREFTRLHPGTYAGSTVYSTQLLREAFANALDEHNIGHGDIITVTVDTTKNIITCSDEGQGFPVNTLREDGETILSASFNVLNTSGKYTDEVYGGSALGLNGIGLKLICYLSDESNIWSTDGSGKSERVYYKDGIFSKREIENCPKGKHGTTVTWHPDPQFFHNEEINYSEVDELFTGISALCPNLTIHLIKDNDKTVYHSQNGITDLINNKVKNKEILHNRFYSKRADKDSLFDICLTYTDNYSEDLTAYVNYGLTDSGTHITALRSQITRLVNKVARDKKLLKEKDANLTGQELSEGLVIIFNLKANGVEYDSQSKTKVVDIDRTLLNLTMSEDFSQWLETNEKDLKIIVDKALLARAAREKAKKARETVRKADKKKRATLPGTLADASSKNRKECEVFIVEGKSAAGSTKEARDRLTQAVFPVRGKILNVLKADLHKALQNAEINGMITAFGLEIKDNKVIVDENKLRYGKIVITADADVDGSHIRALFLTFIWKFAPELITKGYIYAAVPPLYKITQGTKIKYLKDDAALEDFRRKNSRSFELGRMKGLGEMDPSEMAETVMNAETRTLKQITMESAESVAKVFLELMGESTTPRKKFIEENAWRANIDV